MKIIETIRCLRIQEQMLGYSENQSRALKMAIDALCVDFAKQYIDGFVAKGLK